VSARKTLKNLLQQKSILVAPGIYDALGGLLAEQAGFRAVYLSGASIAYSRFGRPDIGLVSMTEVAGVLGAIRERIEIPIIVDADTGFGNALNVARTVRLFERNGAAAIQLEDQTLPKRCGHLAGKTLASTGEMVGKIKAALDARASTDTLIIARTDAIAVDGLDAALERAERYAEAGADILFIEAPKSDADMAAITSRFGARIPLLANMVEGGQTPAKSAGELQEIGFKITIFPGGLARAVAHAARQYFANLAETGSNAANLDRMMDFDALNDVIGTADMLAEGQKYDPKNFENTND
jgi:2-methylisocitrate lyase-like PEP mutase family enzyme